MKLKVILTGAQGLVGEGVLLQCLESPVIGEVLSIGRWSTGIKHSKLRELLVPDLSELDAHESELTGYHACFYCARIVPAGLDDELYAKFVIEPALSLVSRLLILNPNMVLSFLSKYNGNTKSGYGKINYMVEAALSKIIFRRVVFFRTRIVIPMVNQSNAFILKRLMAYCYPVLKFLLPNKINSTKEIGSAMVNTLITDCERKRLNVKEIRALALKDVQNDVKKPFVLLAED